MRLTIQDRNGKASLWLDERCIWDIPNKHVSEPVLDAIVHAYEMGRESAMKEMAAGLDGISSRVPYGTVWIDARSEANR